MNIRMYNDLFKFILTMTSKHNIDESHGIAHSFNVLQFAHNIYNAELYNNPGLKSHEKIVYISAAIHDMCDKKYMTESEGLDEIKDFIKEKVDENETNAIIDIISTMSYSKVKKDGFPNLGLYLPAYHVVREADLMSAYDFDRCILYDMNVNKNDFTSAFHHADSLFNERVLKHMEDKLFTTQYCLQNAPILHNQAILRIQSWRQILKIK